MIKTKTDYTNYINADRLGAQRDLIKDFFEDFFLPANIRHFKVLLRRCEYYKNVKTGMLNKLIYLIVKYRFKKVSLKLGFSIPENVFGPGLSIPHYGTIIVNANARVGANCRIHACTNIGESGGISGAPMIGDNVYIGPGAKIYGNIIIANNVAIAANAAVSKSFFNEHKIIGGVPAKEIGEVDIKNIIKHI